jgi:hypothetical protein
MKKRILPVMLLILPYLGILTAVLYIKYNSYISKEILHIFPKISCGFAAAVYFSNIIYAFVLAKRGANSSDLLFWDMLIKLCNIPIYTIIFIFSFFMSFVPKGIVIAIPMAIFDYLLLIPSTMYGISGLLKARREEKITMTTAVVNGIAHFLFCADVISAIIMYGVIKVKESKKSVMGS